FFPPAVGLLTGGGGHRLRGYRRPARRSSGLPGARSAARRGRRQAARRPTRVVACLGSRSPGLNRLPSLNRSLGPPSGCRSAGVPPRAGPSGVAVAVAAAQVALELGRDGVTA